MSTNERLETILAEIGPATIAVSGGVDSMTLASAAHRWGGAPSMYAVHATSPAVPGNATQRVRHRATREGWNLLVIEAGEFADANYRANPVNRCFFCKTNLYGAIRAATARPILSGANLDDLGEYRPGLDAAREHGVRHPFVEAGMSKAAVRALARTLGLDDLAELPSAPCLSSRVETGIRIEPDLLHFVHGAETLVAARLPAATAKQAVRCRIRPGRIEIELDARSLNELDEAGRVALTAEIAAIAPAHLARLPLLFAPYRTGSAFLVEQAGASSSTPARPERV